MDPAYREDVLAHIGERNATIEDNDRWIRHSYEGLLIRRLANVSEREVDEYRDYLDDDGTVYIVVHPAFYPFFHGFRKLSTEGEEGPFSTMNVIDKFLALRPTDSRFAVLQAQERRMRDFIEFKSTEGKLVILVIPKNYATYKGYTYRKSNDEYMRYLNEITNFSKSILFVESRSPNRGYITEENSIRLMEFLLSINAKRVYLMGGYIGRCLEDFYKFITEDYGSEGISVIPEMSDISPEELSEPMARALLLPNGSLDDETLTKFILSDVYRVQERTPVISHLE
jgi:hypothetical protein